MQSLVVVSFLPFLGTVWFLPFTVPYAEYNDLCKAWFFLFTLSRLPQIF